MTEGELRRRAWATLAYEQRLFGEHIHGARALSGDGWVASVVPSAPESPLLNAIVAERPGAIGAALGGTDGAFQGSRWGAWADVTEPRDTMTLRRAGMISQFVPWRLMAAPIDGLPLDHPDGEPTDDLGLVGAVNDVAYGLSDSRLERHFAPLPADIVRGYRIGNASVLAVVDRGDDAGFLFVATVPDARQRGLAAALMRRALVDARARGMRTGSLLATEAGRPLYARLGFRDLGEARLFELPA